MRTKKSVRQVGSEDYHLRIAKLNYESQKNLIELPSYRALPISRGSPYKLHIDRAGATVAPKCHRTDNFSDG